MSHSAVPFTVEGKVTRPCPLIITAEESGEAKRNIQCQSPALSRKQLIAERFVLFPECVSPLREDTALLLLLLLLVAFI